MTTEDELRQMEDRLREQYCEAGKLILEKAEQESRKVNSLVDQIISARRKLTARAQELEGEDNHGTEEYERGH